MQDVGSFVRTKIFHDDEAARKEEQEELIKIARDPIGDTYIEEDPTVAEWLHSLAPTKAGAVQYFRDLFPSARWARRYNTHWLIGDAIAGKLPSEYKPAVTPN
jgi:sodium-independent sulfate anion transporter 11